MDMFRLLGLIVWNGFAVFGLVVFIGAVGRLAIRGSKASK